MLKLLMVFLFVFGQMGLLTSFHILFDMPKEDIGNRLTVSNQREREDRKDISGIPADCLQRNIRLSSTQASKQVIIPSL